MHLIKPLPPLYKHGRCRKCGRPARPRQRARAPRLYLPRPRTLPFWRGGVSARNMADGDRMLDDDGNVILDDDGNILLDDGAGCSSCCAPPVCDACQTNNVTVTVVGLACCFSGCQGPDSSFDLDGAPISGTWSLTWAGPFGVLDCRYSGFANIGTRGHLYDCLLVDGCDPCSGPICDIFNEISLNLVRNSATGKWRIGIALESIQSIFDSGDFDPPDCPGTDCDNFCWTKSVSNIITTCFNSGSCGAGIGGGTYYTGGTATITVGTGGHSNKNSGMFPLTL